jgi:hypothetical protein
MDNYIEKFIEDHKHLFQNNWEHLLLVIHFYLIQKKFVLAGTLVKSFSIDFVSKIFF